MKTSKSRTRLSPAARKQQLLATARGIILDAGLQSFTMEALAREAGVSSPLVYNYFDSRLTLLQQLLQQEYNAFTEKMTTEVSAADGFEAVVRVFVTSNFDHRAPGNILPILQSQPDIASGIKPGEAANHQQTASFLINNMASHYKLSKKQAELMVRMSSGASIAAAEFCADADVDREQAIDVAMDYIFAGLERIANR